jgi:L-iditol 2-dehydrogenase
MRAIRFHGRGDARVETVPDPVPRPGEVLIAVDAAGMCATDIHILDGHYPATPPLTIGHEFAGRIVDMAPDIDRSRIDELVTVEPHEYCRQCLYCRIGQEHMCVDKRAYGVHLDGGMAEFVAVPARLAYPLPEGVPALFGAMTEPIACSVHAMDRLAPVSGLPVAIHGCGPAGSFLIGLSRLAGLSPIIAADPRPDRRDLALRVGADLALDPTAADFAERALENTDGYGFPYQIDAVGSPAIIEKAIVMASRRGTILFFGVAEPAATTTIRPQEIYAKELSLLGTAINPYTHRRAVGLLRRLPLNQLRTTTFSLDQAHDAFAAQRAGHADKVFVAPTADL